VGYSNFSYTTTKTEGRDSPTAESKSFNQIYDINWNRALTPKLNCRLNLRYNEVDTEDTVDGESKKGFTKIFQPGIEFNYSGPSYSLNIGYRGRESTVGGSDKKSIKTTDNNFYTRANWNFLNILPLNFQYDLNTSKNDASPKTQDSENSRFLFGTQYSIGKINLFYNLTNFKNKDNLTDFERDQNNQVVNINYNNNFWRNRISLGGTYALNTTDTSENFKGPAGFEQSRVILGIKSGFSGKWEKGIERFDFEQRQDSLIDRNKSSGFSITKDNLDTLAFEERIAMGVEFVFKEEVNEMFIYFDSEILQTSFSDYIKGNDLFDIYYSDDNKDVPNKTKTWKLLSVFQEYNNIQNRVEIKFAKQGATDFIAVLRTKELRDILLKANIQSVTIVEFEFLNPLPSNVDVKGKGSRDSSFNTQSTNLNFAFNPIEIINLNYNFSLTKNTQKQDQQKKISDENGSHTVALSFIPHRLFRLLANLQNSFSDSNQKDFKRRESNSYTVTVGTNPLDTLFTTLSYVADENKSGGKKQTESESVNWNMQAKLYRNLNLQMDFTDTQSKDFESGNNTQTDSMNVNLDSNLTERIKTTLLYRYTTTKSSNTKSVTTNSVDGFITYTLSTIFFLNTRYNYQETDGSSTLGQQYQIDWVIFPKLSLFINYRRQDQKPNEGKSIWNSTWLSNLRWNINRYMDINTNYILSQNSESQKTTSIFTSLNLRF